MRVKTAKIPCRFLYKDGSLCTGEIVEFWDRMSSKQTMVLCSIGGSHGYGYSRWDKGAYMNELGLDSFEYVPSEWETKEVPMGWGTQTHYVRR